MSASRARATLFLGGDVMTGRGVDQILAHPSSPELHEPAVRDARDYVELVEAASGRIARPVPDAYPWGDALEAMLGAHARVVNLETSVTRATQPWPDKDVCYRMHPDNVGCLAAARIDVASLANNHALDFGRDGLAETLATLDRAGIRVAGAGATRAEAEAPAVVPLGDARLVVFGVGSATSGIPRSWAATDASSGVAWLEDLGPSTAERVRAFKRPGDLVVVSIHWGTNYGWSVDAPFVPFARALVDAGADVVHGHSSHHPRPLEVYRGKLVLYGCGDFVDDYEAIAPDEEFRIDLAVAWLASFDGELAALRGIPLRRRRMRLERASAADASWLARRLGLRVADGALTL